MPFGSEQWMYSTGFYPYEIDQSLRFNDDNTAYLNRTPASAGNRKTWTWSGWVKRGNLGTTQHIFEGVSGATDILTFLRFGFDDKIRFASYNSGYQFQLYTSAVFRDTSAWYHIVAHLDTTQATSSNRAKIYINGEQVTSFSTASYPTLNHDSYVNITDHHFIGKWNINGTRQFDGYMAEVNFIDGQALDATSFGEFKSGVWIPKSYSGSYGTNGFYLDFGNSGSLGADSSGNGNNWTPVNLAATDQMLDSPTNNFATLNPLETATRNATLSEGNLQYTYPSTGNFYAAIGQGITSGKHYWEMYVDSRAAQFGLSAGVIVGTQRSYGASSYFFGSEVYKVFQNGLIYHGGSTTAYAGTYNVGDVVGIAVDADNRDVWISVNGTFYGSPTAGTGGMAATVSDPFPDGDIFPLSETLETTALMNFGQDSSFAGNKTAQGNTDANGIGDFYYAPPAGYLALCTANLPDPAIDPAQDDVPADYFNTVLYSGNSSTQSITGVGFQPDLNWIKKRSDTGANDVVDVVRGKGGNTDYLYLRTERTSAEAAQNDGDGVLSLDSDGFTVGYNNGGAWNLSGETYVAWNWLADNTSGSSNTDGTITSTVSANQKAGFSIVNYNTGGSSSVTVGHGLDQTPEMIIIKNRDDASNWLVWHEGLFSTNHYLLLQSTAAEASGVTWNPTATTFQAGHNASHNWIGYCFHSVEGFSKFGSYTGNGSTDGPFVYTGFRPAFVMIKRTNDIASWAAWDSTRDTYNPMDTIVFPNLSNAEATNAAYNIDALSNGFKVRNTATSFNGNTSTYIYMAFAEMPFKYSLGR